MILSALQGVQLRVSSFAQILSLSVGLVAMMKNGLDIDVQVCR
jgi:hypothetical protein